MFEDILKEVQETVPEHAVTACANEAWEQSCYDLQLFTVGDRKVTRAEAFATWSRDGFNAYHCRLMWTGAATRLEKGCYRVVDSTWKAERLQALMAAPDRRAATAQLSGASASASSAHPHTRGTSRMP